MGRYAVVPRCTQLSLLRRGLRYLRHMRLRGSTRADVFAVYRSSLNVPVAAEKIPDAFTPDFLREAGHFNPLAAIEDAIASAPSRDPWDVVMHVDLTTYLPGLLSLEDKLSMAHSLEARVPLLDNELVDYLLDVDWRLLSDGSTGKILFRDAVRPLVPDMIYRKPKMGFGPPDASWYRGALQGFIENQLAETRIRKRGVVQPAFVRRVLDEHFAGQANHVALIWCLLSFEAWCKQSGAYGGPLQ